jgi:DNA-binding response OmpR family regulator
MTKTNILIIDDEPETVDMVKTFLELFEFEVASALTGAAGMQAALEGLPKVIILDLMLPDADGFQICRLLRHHAATRTIPILILSARVSKDDENKALRAGATVYLRKPVDLNRLVEDMRRVAASGHVAPSGFVEASDPADKTRPGTFLKGPSAPDGSRPPNRPGLIQKTDTVHIPGMYIPRLDKKDKPADKE